MQIFEINLWSSIYAHCIDKEARAEESEVIHVGGNGKQHSKSSD